MVSKCLPSLSLIEAIQSDKFTPFEITSEGICQSIREMNSVCGLLIYYRHCSIVVKFVGLLFLTFETLLIVLTNAVSILYYSTYLNLCHWTLNFVFPLGFKYLLTFISMLGPGDCADRWRFVSQGRINFFFFPLKAFSFYRIICMPITTAKTTVVALRQT